MDDSATLQLPEEVIREVCMSFRTAGDPAKAVGDRLNRMSLLNIALASKSCRRAAQAALFHTLDFQANSARGLSAVLPILAADARKANLVRRLLFSDWTTMEAVPAADGDTRPIRSRIDQLSLSADLRQRMIDALLHRHPHDNSVDTSLALLLCICPKLRLLKMRAPYGVQDSVTMAVLKQKLQLMRLTSDDRNETGFRSITELTISHWDTENATELCTLCPLLELPHLDIFRGRMIRCTGDTPLPSSFISPIKCITLSSSLVDAAGLGQILIACPFLEKLAVTWGSAAVGMSDIDFGEMGRVLRLHGSRIEHLDFNIDMAEDLDHGDSVLGDLRTMSAVQAITMPVFALLQDGEIMPDYLEKNLPISLRTLKLTDSDDQSDAAEVDLQLLSLMKSKVRPALTTIRIRRGEAFSHDLAGTGWGDAMSNRFWVVLKDLGQSAPGISSGE